MHNSKVAENPLAELQQSGQSVWLDSFRRAWIESGELERQMTDNYVTGVTVNPTIFEKSVAAGTEYDASIRELAKQGKNADAIYEALMMEDIRKAADLFRHVYEASKGKDGLVSIELPPKFAFDAPGSINEAERLRRMIDRENVMVKVPGTQQGAEAVEELIYRGVNVNITLLFSIESYEAVAQAYVTGLKRRMAEGLPLDSVASVASFFVSRIDTAVDRELDRLAETTDDDSRRHEMEALHGKAAIANAKLAYARFKDMFGEQFGHLGDRGARIQRVLWASTGTKDPRYSDVYYVENLIGPDTVNTMPPQTLLAFKDHGSVYRTIDEAVDEAYDELRRIQELGIDMSVVTSKLVDEGIRLFQESVDQTMARLKEKMDSTA